MSDPGRRLAPVVRLAPAKLNLTLAVIGRRPDGFHDLHSVFVPLALADRLSLAPRRRCARHAPRRPGRCRAGRRQPRPARARRRPGGRSVAAGRRSGSGAGARGPAREARSRSRPGSAAARPTPRRRSTARWRRGPPSSTRSRAPALRRGLGSDVPFFLAGGPALVEGRGERVDAAPRPARRAAGRPPRDAGGPRPDGRGLRGVRRRPRRRGDGSVRMTLGAPAEELRGGLARGGSRRPGRRPRDRPTTSLPAAAASSCPALVPSAGPSAGSSGGRSACPARARPSGRSILRGRRPRRPPPSSASPRPAGAIVARATARPRSSPRPSPTGSAPRADDPTQHGGQP